ncbi:hypothetical protein [Desulfovibrio gilichinskyi]|uniref:Uncharacterized protein n=1 Tax=Desulfovibrio gilichinskyi TaxID=1519643 RepID=A0A1X7DRJ1_9BACT|nr:hypothetical protein [Desulfovibrio gilichinskyi]SMF20216.1 hypothetical protein SAMN06295933_2238 [Desulfovibrio gilichinskyi]
MFRQDKWSFTGGLGTEYFFEIKKKSSTLPPSGGVYIFSYTHPRGHLAGFEVHPLYIGQTDNLETTLPAPPKLKCITDECWNCTYILLIDDEQARINCVHDLLKNIHPLC